MEKHTAANSHPFLLLLKDSKGGVRSCTPVNCCTMLALVGRRKRSFKYHSNLKSIRQVITKKLFQTNFLKQQSTASCSLCLTPCSSLEQASRLHPTLTALTRPQLPPDRCDVVERRKKQKEATEFERLEVCNHTSRILQNLYYIFTGSSSSHPVLNHGEESDTINALPSHGIFEGCKLRTQICQGNEGWERRVALKDAQIYSNMGSGKTVII